LKSAAIVRIAIIDTIDRTRLRFSKLKLIVDFCKIRRVLQKVTGISPISPAVTPCTIMYKRQRREYVLYSDACICVCVYVCIYIYMCRARRLYCYKNLLLRARKFTCVCMCECMRESSWRIKEPVMNHPFNIG